MAELSLDNIRITASGCNLDYKQALRLAEQVIRGMVRTPRLIAWRDSKRQPLSRDETSLKCCLTRDSGVRVDINDNEYSFIFTETE